MKNKSYDEILVVEIPNKDASPLIPIDAKKRINQHEGYEAL